MDRRLRFALIAAGAGIVAAGVGLVWWERGVAEERATPAWTEAHQPPEGIALQPSMAAAWCASRPPVPACRAGNRVLRTYAPTLGDEPESLIGRF